MDLKKIIIESQKELKILKTNNEFLITKAKFGPSKETKIPLELEEKMSFFVATIIGDGHLKKEKFQIAVQLCNKKLIESIKETCMKLFNRDFNIHTIKDRQGKKPINQMVIDSKSIYLLLNQVFEVQKGKKSNIVCIPRVIKESNNSIKSAFIIGIMVTEGGSRRRGIGMSTSSKRLWIDLIKIFKDIGINVFTDKWIYKKYNKEYYGLYFKKEKINIILNECKDKELNSLFKEVLKIN
jgi:hypothetical protein